MSHNAIADALIKLINASPYSPRKDQIMAVLQGTAPDEKVKVLGAQLGATITVVGPTTIQFNGWQTARKEGTEVSDAEISAAVLDFLKGAILGGHIVSQRH